jgi:predicted exporter
MKFSISALWRRSALWIAAAVVAVLVLGTRLELSFDLSAFFPQRTTLAHDILIEQIRNGPGSRLLVIGISGAAHDELGRASEQLKGLLSANAAFITVMNGEFAEDTTQVPEPVNSYSLLMRDIDYSRDALRRALQLRLQDLAIGGGSALRELIARDPFLLTLDLLENLAPVDMSGDMWFAPDGSAVLMAETHAASIDITAQAEAVHAVQQAFADLPSPTPLALELTGVGAFSVELEQTIRAETTKRSLLASGALLLVLLVVFRRLRLLLLAALPIAMGFLAGLTLVSLLFDTVHGITLAFGITLLGVAVDYPLHLFSHAQHTSGHAAIRRIWPTMLLGLLSTMIAYLALAFSGSQGLAQLGIFTAAGVAVAMLVTRTWLPLLLDQRPQAPPEDARMQQTPVLRMMAAVIVLLVALIAVNRSLDAGLWDDKLSSLSPVPEERLSADRALRSAALTPDMRYQLVLHSDSLESLLRDSESVDLLLADAVDDGLLENWQSVSQILPSRHTQERRQNAIPDTEVLDDRLHDALADTLFRADAFDAFIANANAARSAPLLMPADVASTPLRSWLESHLIQIGDQWVALISVVRPAVAQLAERVGQWGVAVDLVDLQESSVDLVRDYRNGARNTILVAALIIVGLLWYARGQFRQTVWIVLTVTSALAATTAVITALHGSLTVIHLVALLLVLGLGLDYALFLSRSESLSEQRATNRGVLACAASTTLAFGVLAGSTIPVLKFLGLTVAVGSAASFLIAWSGARTARKNTH